MTQSHKDEPTPERNDVVEMTKLREILFGQQFKEHEKRYFRLEEKIKNEFENLRNELNVRMNAFENLESNTIKELEEFKKSTTKIENDIRQTAIGNAKDLSNELIRLQKELTSELATDFDLLDSEKINKSELATMLGELVMRLNAPPRSEKPH